MANLDQHSNQGLHDLQEDSEIDCSHRADYESTGVFEASPPQYSDGPGSGPERTQKQYLPVYDHLDEWFGGRLNLE